MKGQSTVGKSRTSRVSGPDPRTDVQAPNQPTARRVVVLGAPEDIPRALQHPAVGAGRFQVVGALAVEADADSQPGPVDELASLLKAHAAQTILVAGPVGTPVMRRVADFAVVHGCDLLAVMPTEVPAGHDPEIVWTGDHPLVRLVRTRRPAWDWAAKRAMDVVGAGLALVVLGPVVGILGLLIPLESRGWPIFAHERVGLRGRKFNCYKLRTMRADAESVLKADPVLYARYVENHYKIPDDLDPRTTRLGRFLRRTSLDEVPQFWNVLMGDMSLVGPRPVVPEELAMYGDSADLLLSVRPGLTGAWAVGGRHGVGYPERCQMELTYARNGSLSQDVSIIAQTVRAVVAPGQTST